MDAPERVWLDSPEEGFETDVEVGASPPRGRRGTWVEYVRADLYAKLEQERDEAWRRFEEYAADREMLRLERNKLRKENARLREVTCPWCSGDEFFNHMAEQYRVWGDEQKEGGE